MISARFSGSKPLQFLVVDYSFSCRELLAVLFEVYGIETVAVETAGEALNLLLHQQIVPDLLISEIWLPKEDGYSLIRNFKSFSQVNSLSIPAVALTVCTSEHDRARALAAGFDLHMTKPVDIHELMWRIAHLLNKPQILATELPVLA
jgi:CheY-like chemotaxis protein